MEHAIQSAMRKAGYHDAAAGFLERWPFYSTGHQAVIARAWRVM